MWEGRVVVAPGSPSVGLLTLVAELTGRSITHRLDHRVRRRAARGADGALLPVPARGRAASWRRSRWPRSPGASCARTPRRLRARRSCARSVSGASRRRVCALRLTPRLVARLVRGDLALVPRAERRRAALQGRWPLFAPWLHTYSLPVFAVLSVLFAVAWNAVRDWMPEVERTSPTRSSGCAARCAAPRARSRGLGPARSRAAPSLRRSSSSRGRLRFPPDPRQRAPRVSFVSDRPEGERWRTQLDKTRTGGYGLPKPRARAIGLLGPLTVVGGIDLGDRPALPADAAAPAPQGFWWLVIEPPLLVVAAGLFFSLVDRAAADRRPRGRRCSLALRWCTGSSRRGCCARPGHDRAGDRRPGGLGDAALAGLPVARARVRPRDPDVARDDLLHELGDPHGRAQRLGAGADGDGAAELGLAKGKLHSRWWRLAAPVGIAVSGVAFLAHEQNPWFFARSAFLHHLIGWTLVAAALFPLALVVPAAVDVLPLRLRLAVVALAVMLFSDRDVAPVFGHLSPLAGPPHR